MNELSNPSISCLHSLFLKHWEWNYLSGA